MTTERFPIEVGHILMFARAIGDPSTIYSDSVYAASSEVGGIIAPPTFVQGSAQFDPDYGLRPKFNGPWWGSGRHATGVPARGASGGLHAEQHYEYHRPLRAGDVLASTSREGKTWEKKGRRGGTLQFFEIITEYRNVEGELVLTSRSVGVRTSKVVENGG